VKIERLIDGRGEIEERVEIVTLLAVMGQRRKENLFSVLSV
jgi:hypothetical protein